jgi:pimeloyl-ACP methyl ester carboxylesterase
MGRNYKKYPKEKENEKTHKIKITSLAALLASIFLLSALAGLHFTAKVSAAGYTEIIGTLDGAQFVVRFPDSWNGMLVVYCHGYSATTPTSAITSFYNNYISTLLDQGFAVAASTYGTGGFCIQQGMNSTYQLTEYLISTYNVTGKVFLVGGSMGGAIALLLGEKYPNVYSGVLDMFGMKNMTDQYITKARWANLSDADLTAELTALTVPIPIYMFGTVPAFRSYVAGNIPIFENETGGTPTTTPEAYEDRSPVYHANITIPVITIQGTSDAVVPFYETLMYQSAVANAGHSNLYRLYNVTGGEHASPSIYAEFSTRFDELVAWSNDIPEGLHVEVLMLLSALAVAVSAVYFRKRAK